MKLSECICDLPPMVQDAVKKLEADSELLQGVIEVAESAANKGWFARFKKDLPFENGRQFLTLMVETWRKNKQ